MCDILWMCWWLAIGLIIIRQWTIICIICCVVLQLWCLVSGKFLFFLLLVWSGGGIFTLASASMSSLATRPMSTGTGPCLQVLNGVILRAVGMLHACSTVCCWYRINVSVILHSLCLIPGHSGEEFVSCGEDSTMRVWKGKTRLEIFHFTLHCSHFTVACNMHLHVHVQ